MKKTKVAVAMSGGVDSSVAAVLLKEMGYDVVGVFLTCWSEGVGCSIETDRMDAMRVAVKLGVPFRVFNFEKEYQERVIDRFFEAYQKGQTPNPDIWCNEEIKFGLFLEKALSELKVDFIATGHYARVKSKEQREKRKTYHLLMGVDESKDQSYFLYRLNQFQLSKTLFPVGTLTKQSVREI
ncbi:MAG: tRNA 2-thiouridine(34) synthase MnmA, partial [Candidatus Cloacimonetes bacterium]|nr:tRNA 2-thiouridine(34) synthase MnmA [Candidatus Cloacimonadota bacterium]